MNSPAKIASFVYLRNRPVNGSCILKNRGREIFATDQTP